MSHIPGKGVRSPCTIALLTLTATLGAGCNDTTGPVGGEIRVTVTTTGVDFDPDGYVVVVAGAARSVPVNGTATIVVVSTGRFFAQLDGVDPNCSVARNSIPVTIRAGLSTPVAFSVTCISRVGRVRVTTATTGTEVDADGYGVRVDGGPERVIGASSAVIIDDVPGGNRTVELSGVARNCTVAQGNVRSVIVPFGGGTVDASFGIQCVTSGGLEVTAATAGVDLDPNGYSVAVRRADLDTVAALPIGGSVTVPTLIPGDYQVVLLGVAANCDITGQNPRTVAVAAGTTTAVAFDVACAPVMRLAIVKTTDGNADIWTINSNGTGGTRLTTHASDDLEPSWSPDGSKIAFRSERDGNGEIYVMNADGSGLVRLTQHAALDGRPTWSPDGGRIAFESTRDGDSEIYVMNADGSGVVRLTDNDKHDGEPAWSPDGQKIAFTSNRDGNFEIYVMSADGSGVTRLTTHGMDDVQPAWSPDGTKIAFARLVACDFYYGCDHDVYVMNASGPAVTQLTSGSEDHTEPAWSTDGGRIAFTSAVCSDYHCYDFSSSVMAVRTDGTNLAEVTNGSARTPSWRR
jgi:WD40 repeat protein